MRRPSRAAASARSRYHEWFGMSNDAVCERCGERIPPGETGCPACFGQRKYLFLHRDSILLALVLVLAAVLWAVAHYVTAAYAARQQQLAQEWYSRGDDALGAARLEEAVSDLSTALAYSHESFRVRLRLAEALAAGHHVRQAQAYLQALWDEQPGNATVNLELARIAAGSGEAADAIRYYHGAIYGLWNSDPIRNRRDTRLELIHFLLARGAKQQAEAELIAVAADLPRDANVLVQVGANFLEAGDPRRALQEYLAAARLDRHNEAALLGAAQAAFQNQQYAAAARYAAQALDLNPKDATAEELRRTSELVLAMDPAAPRIGFAEAARRLARAFEQAQSRLESCAAGNGIPLKSPFGEPAPQNPLALDYTDLLSLKSRVRSSVLRREPDLLDTAMDVVYRSEADAQQQCGTATGPDAALLLIARQHGANQ